MRLSPAQGIAIPSGPELPVSLAVLRILGRSILQNELATLMRPGKSKNAPLFPPRAQRIVVYNRSAKRSISNTETLGLTNLHQKMTLTPRP